MSPQLTKKDRQFLQSVGITPEPITSFNEERLALAERIAKHAAPTAQADPEVARHELIRLAAREIANLPKRAKLDLLTMITLQRLVKEFRPAAKDNE
jgi:hypothetical protein